MFSSVQPRLWAFILMHRFCRWLCNCAFFVFLFVCLLQTKATGAERLTLELELINVEQQSLLQKETRCHCTLNGKTHLHLLQAEHLEQKQRCKQKQKLVFKNNCERAQRNTGRRLRRWKTEYEGKKIKDDDESRFGDRFCQRSLGICCKSATEPE